jgi:NAD(P)-dependent dehydrogenase (short-subunit alcohol dehydrogenase family)
VSTPDVTGTPLTGQVALVTGASRGIGQATAIVLARAGARVAVTARATAGLARTLEALFEAGVPGRAVELEVRDVHSIREAIAHVEEELGPIDILVNNAGVSRLRLALDVTEEDWDIVLDTNLRGAFFVAQAVGRGMVERGSGRIVNVASMAAFRTIAERAAYNASKAGLVALTRLLAVEWGPAGVLVNAVAPTFVATEMSIPTLSRPGRREEIESMIPLRRLPTPEDIAAAVLFLVSPGSAMISGVTLPVDGGFGPG